MSRYLLLSLLFLTLGWCLRTPAMMIAVSENDLLGGSDLIIVGTVLDDTRLPDVPAWNAGLAKIKIDRVLRGPQLAQVTVRHAAVPIMPPGVMIMDHGGFALQPQDQRIFFLSRTVGGYTIVGGTQGMRPVNQVDDFAKKIGDFSISATLVAPVGPFYFGEMANMSIKLKNGGPTTLEIYAPSVEGYFVSERLGGLTLPFKVIEAPLAAAPPVKPAPLSVEAGKEITIPVSVILDKPESWKLFAADTYLLAPFAVRCRLYLKPVAGGPVGDKRLEAAGYSISTNWVLTLSGFPLPDEVKRQQ